MELENVGNVEKQLIVYAFRNILCLILFDALKSESFKLDDFLFAELKFDL